MRISDRSSDVCSSDLFAEPPRDAGRAQPVGDQPGLQEVALDEAAETDADALLVARDDRGMRDRQAERPAEQGGDREPVGPTADQRRLRAGAHPLDRSEDHPSELQSLTRTSYAGLCM